VSFYAFAKMVVRAAALVLWRVRVCGAQNVPAEGPLIIACNHVSLLDPPILGAFCPRKLHYMAKRELFAIPLLGSLIGALGAFPIDREGSATGAIKRSIDILRSGETVGIFPEGGRNPRGEARARAGVALLAELGKSAVLPAAIVGSNNAMRFGRVTVLFGRPLQLDRGEKPTREELTVFTQTVMREIRALSENVVHA
jgi:1-acyl-sn-glycerol-3-phosphate acyltransferase